MTDLELGPHASDVMWRLHHSVESVALEMVDSIWWPRVVAHCRRAELALSDEPMLTQSERYVDALAAVGMKKGEAHRLVVAGGRSTLQAARVVTDNGGPAQLGHYLQSSASWAHDCAAVAARLGGAPQLRSVKALLPVSALLADLAGYALTLRTVEAGFHSPTSRFHMGNLAMGLPEGWVDGATTALKPPSTYGLKRHPAQRMMKAYDASRESLDRFVDSVGQPMQRQRATQALVRDLTAVSRALEGMNAIEGPIPPADRASAAQVLP